MSLQYRRLLRLYKGRSQSVEVAHFLTSNIPTPSSVSMALPVQGTCEDSYVENGKKKKSFFANKKKILIIILIYL